MSMNGFYLRTHEGIEVIDCTYRADLRLSAMNFLEHRQNRQEKRKSRGKLVKGLLYKVAGILTVILRGVL